MDEDWRTAITLEMVPPVRHQEHLYNVNVMEMFTQRTSQVAFIYWVTIWWIYGQ